MRNTRCHTRAPGWRGCWLCAPRASTWAGYPLKRERDEWDLISGVGIAVVVTDRAAGIGGKFELVYEYESTAKCESTPFSPAPQESTTGRKMASRREGCSTAAGAVSVGPQGRPSYPESGEVSEAVNGVLENRGWLVVGMWLLGHGRDSVIAGAPRVDRSIWRGRQPPSAVDPLCSR